MLPKWLRIVFGIAEPKAIPALAAVPNIAPRTKSKEEILDNFRSYLTRDIAAGYKSHEDILQFALEMADDEDFEVVELDRVGPEILKEEIDAHIASQAAWPKVTDYERLSAAFAALEEKGIISREDYTCCGTCGSAEIGYEMKEAMENGSDVRGYTFFHQQDTESAVEGDGLYLNYGSTEANDEACISIGHEIQAALEANGLTTDWDGDISRRIGVTLDWKRRMTGA
jgi:hypothetical protein